MKDNIVLHWIALMLPEIVLQRVVEPKQLKACGTVSGYVVKEAKKDGFNAYEVDSQGHVTAYIDDPSRSGKAFSVDATHLQFKFPYHGGLRDFGPDERDSAEYRKMRALFEELSEDPMKAVKVTEVESL